MRTDARLNSTLVIHEDTVDLINGHAAEPPAINIIFRRGRGRYKRKLFSRSLVVELGGLRLDKYIVR